MCMLFISKNWLIFKLTYFMHINNHRSSTISKSPCMKMTLLQHLNHISSWFLQFFFTPFARPPVYLSTLIYQLTHYFSYKLKLYLLLVVNLFYHHLVVYFYLYEIFTLSLCVIFCLVEVQPLLIVYLVKPVDQPTCLLHGYELDQCMADLLR